MNFKYSAKSLSELNIGDILFFNLDENNLPLNRYIIIYKINETVYLALDLDKHLKLENLILDPEDDFYVIGNSIELLENKNILKKPNKYFWMGIKYENYRLLICISDLSVEILDINKKNTNWSILETDEEVIQINNTLYINIPNTNINLFVDLNCNKVKIFNETTKRYNNYKEFKLSKSDEAVFDNDFEFNKS